MVCDMGTRSSRLRGKRFCCYASGCRAEALNAKTAVIDAKLRLFGNGSVAMQVGAEQHLIQKWRLSTPNCNCFLAVAI
jgi:hypothetical protein